MELDPDDGHGNGETDRAGLPDTFGLPPKYPIDSVDNALRLLLLLRWHSCIRVKDVARELNVATGTAHRLLSMLVYRGYLTRDADSRGYTTGVALLSIGLQAMQRSDLRSAATPFLDQLKDELDETIQLATLEGSEVFFVDARESSKALRVASRAGTLRPAHCTSVGKALLAELDRDAILEMYRSESLPAVTQNSIRTRSQLLLELDAVRTRGYAVNFSELEDGIGSVAAVVRGGSGRAVAAIGAGGPLSRLDDLRMEEIGRVITTVAADFGQELARTGIPDDR